MPTPLTDLERDILMFSNLWWRNEGAREQAIRDRFGMSAVRFHQLQNGLLDREEALAFDPLLVRRLRELRAGRQRSRPTGRTLAAGTNANAASPPSE